MKDAFRNLFDELNIKKVVYVDNEFEIEITSDDNMTFKMEFKEPMLNHFLRDWQSIKQLAELGRVSPEDYELWKNMRSSYSKAYTED